MNGTILKKADLSGATLFEANMSKANLQYIDLSKASLNYANLSGASLNFAKLEEANLNEANLQKANLFGANLSNAEMMFANLSKAILENTILTGVKNFGWKIVDWKLNNVFCEYVYNDIAGKKRMPMDRNFLENEFEKVFSQKQKIIEVYQTKTSKKSKIKGNNF